MELLIDDDLERAAWLVDSKCLYVWPLRERARELRFTNEIEIGIARLAIASSRLALIMFNHVHCASVMGVQVFGPHSKETWTGRAL